MCTKTEEFRQKNEFTKINDFNETLYQIFGYLNNESLTKSLFI